MIHYKVREAVKTSKILELIGQGMKPQEIAKAIPCSVRTVYNVRYEYGLTKEQRRTI